MSMRVHSHASPVGPIRLYADEAGLAGVFFEQFKPGVPPARAEVGAHPAIDAAKRQLDQYFAGRRTAFDLPLSPRGTPFQRRVWDLLAAIPFGATTTYGALAAQLGKPNAARAVGAAVGRNPLGIVIPCHRVVGADGALTGFAGGIACKQFLLAHEGAAVARAAAAA